LQADPATGSSLGVSCVYSAGARPNPAQKERSPILQALSSVFRNNLSMFFPSDLPSFAAILALADFGRLG